MKNAFEVCLLETQEAANWKNQDNAFAFDNELEHKTYKCISKSITGRKSESISE